MFGLLIKVGGHIPHVSTQKADIKKYLKKINMYGATHIRTIYEKAVEILRDEQAREMCMRFADLERKLGEIDRARTVYAHCSQMSDPRSAPSFWQTWKEFEIKHGNEDTVREMLRIKRSVQATYNTQVNFMSAQMLAATSAKDMPPGEEADEMKKLEQQARLLAEAAEKDKPKTDKGILFVRSDATINELDDLTRTNNPEEIDIGSDFGSDDERDVPEVEVEPQNVPSEVFGNLAKDDD